MPTAENHLGTGSDRPTVKVAEFPDDIETVPLQESPHLLLVKIAYRERLDDISGGAFDTVDEVNIQHLPVQIDPPSYLVSLHGLAGARIGYLPVKRFRLDP